MSSVGSTPRDTPLPRPRSVPVIINKKVGGGGSCWICLSLRNACCSEMSRDSSEKRDRNFRQTGCMPKHYRGPCLWHYHPINASLNISRHVSLQIRFLGGPRTGKLSSILISRKSRGSKIIPTSRKMSIGMKRTSDFSKIATVRMT